MILRKLLIVLLALLVVFSLAGCGGSGGGGDDPNGYVVGDGFTRPNGAEIKTKLPNGLGIYDMNGFSGNAD